MTVWPAISTFLHFAFPIITLEPLDRFDSNIYLGIRENFESLSLVGHLLKGKIAEIMILDQLRVNGGNNYVTWAAPGSQVRTYIIFLYLYITNEIIRPAS